MSSSRRASAAGTTLYSIATVAERLAISQDTVRRLIARSELTAIRIGSAVRVDAAELEAFLDRQRAEGHRADRRRASSVHLTTSRRGGR
jgi:excisionase family DNA binding protein